ANYARQYLLVLAIVGNHLIARPHVGVPGGFMFFDGTKEVPLNTWTHLAMTYDGSFLRLFVNGSADGALAVTGPLITTSQPLRIGGLPSGPWYFNGLIDEVSLYSRAISGTEIQAIYNASGSGKCFVPVQPSIFAQPSDQTVTVGQTATFTVAASGTSLSYQWSFNGMKIVGPSSASLVLTNVQMNQAGSYSVQVSNTVGIATSSNALLT